MPLDNLTLAIFLKAEFGFFGVVVVTFKQTPLLKGEPDGKKVLFLCKVSITLSKAGDLLFFLVVRLPLRTSWLTVGINIHPVK
jgi:hypothetical protein